MHKLEFLNPVGTNNPDFTTVRLGTKWAERTQPGEDGTPVEVELVCDGRSLGKGEVFGCWTGSLAMLPALLLEAEHDPVCRTWSGLRAVLAGTYPDEEWTMETVVTVLQVRYVGSIIATPDLILPK